LVRIEDCRFRIADFRFAIVDSGYVLSLGGIMGDASDAHGIPLTRWLRNDKLEAGELFLQDWVVAVTDEFCLRGLGILEVAERTHLDMEEFIGG